MSRYLRNAWYVAGFAEEFTPEKLIARTLLDQPMVMFRNGMGGITALADRCPHRFAPLSLGRICDGGRSVRSGYHGLEFGPDGRCTRNPHSDKAIPKAAAVASYAVRENAGLVWLWGGDAALADESLMPDFSAVTCAPPEATIKGYMPAACSYELLVDNILDLTHVDYLHPTTLGSGALAGVQPQVSDRGERSVHIVWQSSGQPAPAAFDMGLRLQGQPTDQWTEVTWKAPSCMLLNVGATLLGETRAQGASTLNLHLATPETATTMHYWYWTTRSFAIGAEANAQIRPILEHVFTQEDKPMIEAQQRQIGSADYDTLKPVLLTGDAGSVRVRRHLRQLMDAEHTA